MNYLIPDRAILSALHDFSLNIITRIINQKSISQAFRESEADLYEELKSILESISKFFFNSEVLDSLKFFKDESNNSYTKNLERLGKAYLLPDDVEHETLLYGYNSGVKDGIVLDLSKIRARLLDVTKRNFPLINRKKEISEAIRIITELEKVYEEAVNSRNTNDTRNNSGSNKAINRDSDGNEYNIYNNNKASEVNFNNAINEIGNENRNEFSLSNVNNSQLDNTILNINSNSVNNNGIKENNYLSNNTINNIIDKTGIINENKDEKSLYEKFLNVVNIYAETGSGKTLYVKEVGYFLYMRNYFSDGIFYFDIQDMKSVDKLKFLFKEKSVFSYNQDNNDLKKILIILDNADKVVKSNTALFFNHLVSTINNKNFHIMYILVTNKKIYSENEKIKLHFIQLKKLSKIESAYLFLNSLQRKIEPIEFLEEINSEEFPLSKNNEKNNNFAYDFIRNQNYNHLIDLIVNSPRLEACLGLPKAIKKLADLAKSKELSKINYIDFAPKNYLKQRPSGANATNSAVSNFFYSTNEGVGNINYLNFNSFNFAEEGEMQAYRKELLQTGGIKHDQDVKNKIYQNFLEKNNMGHKNKESNNSLKINNKYLIDNSSVNASIRDSLNIPNDFKNFSLRNRNYNNQKLLQLPDNQEDFNLQNKLGFKQSNSNLVKNNFNPSQIDQDVNYDNNRKRLNSNLNMFLNYHDFELFNNMNKNKKSPNESFTKINQNERIIKKNNNTKENYPFLRTISSANIGKNDINFQKILNDQINKNNFNNNLPINLKNPENYLIKNRERKESNHAAEKLNNKIENDEIISNSSHKTKSKVLNKSKTSSKNLSSKSTGTHKNADIENEKYIRYHKHNYEKDQIALKNIFMKKYTANIDFDPSNIYGPDSEIDVNSSEVGKITNSNNDSKNKDKLRANSNLGKDYRKTFLSRNTISLTGFSKSIEKSEAVPKPKQIPENFFEANKRNSIPFKLIGEEKRVITINNESNKNKSSSESVRKETGNLVNNIDKTILNKSIRDKEDNKDSKESDESNDTSNKIYESKNSTLKTSKLKQENNLKDSSEIVISEIREHLDEFRINLMLNPKENNEINKSTNTLNNSINYSASKNNKSSKISRDPSNEELNTNSNNNSKRFSNITNILGQGNNNLLLSETSSNIFGKNANNKSNTFAYENNNITINNNLNNNNSNSIQEITSIEKISISNQNNSSSPVNTNLRRNKRSNRVNNTVTNEKQKVVFKINEADKDEINNLNKQNKNYEKIDSSSNIISNSFNDFEDNIIRDKVTYNDDIESFKRHLSQSIHTNKNPSARHSMANANKNVFNSMVIKNIYNEKNINTIKHEDDVKKSNVDFEKMIENFISKKVLIIKSNNDNNNNGNNKDDNIQRTKLNDEINIDSSLNLKDSRASSSSNNQLVGKSNPFVLKSREVLIKQENNENKINSNNNNNNNRNTNSSDNFSFNRLSSKNLSVYVENRSPEFFKADKNLRDDLNENTEDFKLNATDISQKKREKKLNSSKSSKNSKGKSVINNNNDTSVYSNADNNNDNKTKKIYALENMNEKTKNKEPEKINNNFDDFIEGDKRKENQERINEREKDTLNNKKQNEKEFIFKKLNVLNNVVDDIRYTSLDNKEENNLNNSNSKLNGSFISVVNLNNSNIELSNLQKLYMKKNSINSQNRSSNGTTDVALRPDSNGIQTEKINSNESQKKFSLDITGDQTSKSTKILNKDTTPTTKKNFNLNLNNNTTIENKNQKKFSLFDNLNNNNSNNGIINKNATSSVKNLGFINNDNNNNNEIDPSHTNGQKKFNLFDSNNKKEEKTIRPIDPFITSSPPISNENLENNVSLLKEKIEKTPNFNYSENTSELNKREEKIKINDFASNLNIKTDEQTKIDGSVIKEDKSDAIGKDFKIEDEKKGKKNFQLNVFDTQSKNVNKTLNFAQNNKQEKIIFTNVLNKKNEVKDENLLDLENKDTSEKIVLNEKAIAVSATKNKDNEDLNSSKNANILNLKKSKSNIKETEQTDEKENLIENRENRESQFLSQDTNNTKKSEAIMNLSFKDKQVKDIRNKSMRIKSHRKSKIKHKIRKLSDVSSKFNDSKKNQKNSEDKKDIKRANKKKERNSLKNDKENYDQEEIGYRQLASVRICSVSAIDSEQNIESPFVKKKEEISESFVKEKISEPIFEVIKTRKSIYNKEEFDDNLESNEKEIPFDFVNATERKFSYVNVINENKEYLYLNKMNNISEKIESESETDLKHDKKVNRTSRVTYRKHSGPKATNQPRKNLSTSRPKTKKNIKKEKTEGKKETENDLYLNILEDKLGANESELNNRKDIYLEKENPESNQEPVFQIEVLQDDSDEEDDENELDEMINDTYINNTTSNVNYIDNSQNRDLKYQKSNSEIINFNNDLSAFNLNNNRSMFNVNNQQNENSNSNGNNNLHYSNNDVYSPRNDEYNTPGNTRDFFKNIFKQYEKREKKNDKKNKSDSYNSENNIKNNSDKIISSRLVIHKENDRSKNLSQNENQEINTENRILNNNFYSSNISNNLNTQSNNNSKYVFNNNEMLNNSYPNRNRSHSPIENIENYSTKTVADNPKEDFVFDLLDEKIEFKISDINYNKLNEFKADLGNVKNKRKSILKTNKHISSTDKTNEKVLEIDSNKNMLIETNKDTKEEFIGKYQLNYFSSVEKNKKNRKSNNQFREHSVSGLKSYSRRSSNSVNTLNNRFSSYSNIFQNANSSGLIWENSNQNIPNNNNHANTLNNPIENENYSNNNNYISLKSDSLSKKNSFFENTKSIQYIPRKSNTSNLSTNKELLHTLQQISRNYSQKNSKGGSKNNPTNKNKSLIMETDEERNLKDENNLSNNNNNPLHSKNYSSKDYKVNEGLEVEEDQEEIEINVFANEEEEEKFVNRIRSVSQSDSENNQSNHSDENQEEDDDFDPFIRNQVSIQKSHYEDLEKIGFPDYFNFENDLSNNGNIFSNNFNSGKNSDSNNYNRKFKNRNSLAPNSRDNNNSFNANYSEISNYNNNNNNFFSSINNNSSHLNNNFNLTIGNKNRNTNNNDIRYDPAGFYSNYNKNEKDKIKDKEQHRNSHKFSNKLENNLVERFNSNYHTNDVAQDNLIQNSTSEEGLFLFKNTLSNKNISNSNNTNFRVNQNIINPNYIHSIQNNKIVIKDKKEITNNNINKKNKGLRKNNYLQDRNSKEDKDSLTPNQNKNQNYKNQKLKTNIENKINLKNINKNNFNNSKNSLPNSKNVNKNIQNSNFLHSNSSNLNDISNSNNSGDNFMFTMSNANSSSNKNYLNVNYNFTNNKNRPAPQIKFSGRSAISKIDDPDKRISNQSDYDCPVFTDLSTKMKGEINSKSNVSEFEDKDTLKNINNLSNSENVNSDKISDSEEYKDKEFIDNDFVNEDTLLESNQGNKFDTFISGNTNPLKKHKKKGEKSGKMKNKYSKKKKDKYHTHNK